MELKLIRVACGICLLLLSGPLHELSHRLFLKVMGCKTKLKIRWLQFSLRGISGYVNPDNDNGTFVFPATFKNHYKIFSFFLGLSGGWGAAIMMSFGFLFLFYFPEFANWGLRPLLVVIVFQLLYGLKEAIEVYSEVELVGEEKSSTKLTS